MPTGKELILGTAGCILLFAFSFASAREQNDSTDIQRRLDRLAVSLEQRRQELHIPGMAIAVVQGDEVILARGFGLADVEKKEPVTPETLFSIGSTTKAFTATLIGSLVDEGTMDWDDDVTRYLPAFQLAVRPAEDGEGGDGAAGAAQAVTIRDLLSHRTGFTRMTPLFANGEVRSAEILATAVNAKPRAAFRERFLYNNIMYLAAGTAAAKAAGSTWSALIEQRILEPLGMQNSTTSVATVGNNPRLARGYLWDDVLSGYRSLPLRCPDNVAPAGALASNVTDMARWIRCLLGGGLFEGHRVISEKRLRETWTGQIEAGGGVQYGLGWMISAWRGQPMIFHGGNIDGFAAHVALLPESKLGFVLLCNVTATSLQGQSMSLVWEALLGEPKDDGAQHAAARDLTPFVGKYRANFGAFKDAEFEIAVQDESLTLDVPSQTAYKLRAPDGTGKWFFALTDQVAVSFVRDAEGRIIAMMLYQGGMEFELPRVGIEIEPEIPLDELQKYLGRFHSEKMNETLSMVIKNNCLALAIPGQKTYELRAPNEQGRWVFQVVDLISVSFGEDENGRVTSLTYYEGDGKLEYERILGDARLLPTSAEIASLRESQLRRTAFDGWGGTRITGRVDLPQCGLKGKVIWTFHGPDRLSEEIDLGPFGCRKLVIDGQKGWNVTVYGRVDPLRDRYLEQAKLRHPLALFGDWKHFFDSIEVLAAEDIDGRSVYRIKLSSGNAPAYRVFMDSETSDVIRAETALIQPGVDLQLPQTLRFEDFRVSGGVSLPFRLISSFDAVGETVIEIETIERGLELDDRLFQFSEEK